MTEELIISYLLEELSVAEQNQVEENCFAADTWPEEIGLAEESLIDDYLRGTLVPARRILFEKNYLVTAARMKKVAAASAFLRYVDEQHIQNKVTAAEKVSWGANWRALWSGRHWALAATLLLVVLVTCLWWRRSFPPLPQSPATLQLNLMSGTRSPGGVMPPKAALPLPAGMLRVILSLPSNTAALKYQVKMERSDTVEAVNLPHSTPENDSLILTIPARQLTPGQYTLQLYTLDPNNQTTRIPGNYYFDVE